VNPAPEPIERIHFAAPWANLGLQSHAGGAISGQGEGMVLKQIRCSDIRCEGNAGREASVAIQALADSIRTYGVLRPVLLRPTDEGYVMVHGERRWRAAQMLGMEQIPAYLVENLYRDQHVEA